MLPTGGSATLKRGKGNKLMDLKGNETIVALTTFGASDSVQATAGKRTLTLKPADLANHTGKRAQRGTALPKGYQKVVGLAKVMDKS